MEPIRRDSWAAGANNIAPRDRLPEGSVRSAVNVDPLPGGRLALRIGCQRAYVGAAVRAVLALRDKLLIADGADLVEFDTATDSSRVIRQIAGAGPVSGDVLNDRLYFSTATECLEYDGATVRPWGVLDVLQQPTVSAGQGGTLLAGRYQVAMTYTDQWGREGGTDLPVTILVPEGGSLMVTVPSLPSGCKANLYVSSVNGASLYRQRVVATAQAVEIGSVDDDRALCETILCRAPQPGHIVRALNSVLVTAIGGYIQLTRPMRPHLVDRARGFFQFGARVGMVRAGGDVLFVSADKTYGLTNVETGEPQQAVIHDFPACAGTDVALPNDQAAWMTPYGQAISSGEGVLLPSRASFAPGVEGGGVAGFLKHNGNNLIVTVMDGPPRPSPLASADIFLGKEMAR